MLEVSSVSHVSLIDLLVLSCLAVHLILIIVVYWLLHAEIKHSMYSHLFEKRQRLFHKHTLTLTQTTHFNDDDDDDDNDGFSFDIINIQ